MTRPSISILGEPELEFRYGQRVVDPHVGLALFGPYDADTPSAPKGIVYGLTGTPEGVRAFLDFARVISGPVRSVTSGDNLEDQKKRLLWPVFPGVEAVFNSTWPRQPAWSAEVERNALLAAAGHGDPAIRVYEVVNFYLRAIEIAAGRDEQFSLIICVVPDEVYDNCRPQSVVRGGQGYRPSVHERRLRESGQLDLLDTYDPEAYQLSPDFRRQLKARAMRFGIPLQIVRESTLQLSPDTAGYRRSLTTLSDRAWNLSTTIYYKAGGKPWRLSTARPGVCYVGIAFRRVLSAGKEGRTACCAAQMFLDTGDGVVFRGEFGPWYSPERNECHLDRKAARELLTGVLKTYEKHQGQPLKEIFLHSRSSVDREEFEGYREACPSGVKVVGIRVRLDKPGVRLYRGGRWPVLRGTFWKLGERSAYLWASGFKPSLLSYDGWQVPVPLRLDIQHGDSDLEQVAKDILGLTKLNYNACRFGDAEPVTILFSDAVGEILVSNPTVSECKPNFKFYI